MSAPDEPSPAADEPSPPTGEPSPAASVVVPTRGGRHRLATLLPLLEAQDLLDLEVVVVVDGDVDGTADFLEGRSHTVPVRVVLLGENRGRPAALNAGIAVANGRVVIRCDDDLEPGPGFVRAHVEAHRDHPVGAVGLYHNVFPETTYAVAYGRTADERFRRDAYAADPSATWRYWHGNVSVTREVAARVGPYDEAFRAYGWEDVDWGYRLHRLGVPVVLRPELEVTHRLAAVTACSRVERAWFSGAARRRFVAKHGAAPLPSPSRRSPWEVAVRVVSGVLTEGGARRGGALVDRVAAVLPRRIGRALVALLVEAAGDAGYRSGRVSDPTAV